MALSIDQVRSRSELAEFIRLPRHLYQGMPGYVAPLDLERRELLDPKKSPFFTHGHAAYWIARSNGRAVGRISAQIDLLSGPSCPPDLGLFGCLDAVDDPEVIFSLLRTAEDWLRQHRKQLVRGPFILSINGESGLLIDGQSEPPITLLPWHPTYLNQRLQQAGYTCAMRLVSYVIDLNKISTERLQDLVSMRRDDFSFRSMRVDHLEDEMEIGRPLFNDGWQNNWGFTPVSQTDLRGLARSFKAFLLPESCFFVNVRGEPAALALSIPNIFDISANLGAAPSFFGWIKLLFRIWKQRYRTFRLIIIGGASKYHGTGIGKAALAETIRRVHSLGANQLVCAWVLETNSALNRILSEFGFRQSATYGVFEKHLLD